MDAQLKAALASALGSGIASARGSPAATSTGLRGRARRRPAPVRQDQRPLAARDVRRRGAGPRLARPRRARCGSPGWSRWRRRKTAQQFLALELVATGAPARDFDERLGRGLAALHRRGAPGFGLDHDNFVGWLPQANAAAGDLAGVLSRAAARGAAAPGRRRRARVVADAAAASIDCSRRSTSSVGPAEPPARLHGDLWGGNLLCDDRGASLPHRSGRLRRSPGDRSRDDASLRRLRRAGLRRLRRGLAARRRARASGCRSTSSTRSWFT